MKAYISVDMEGLPGIYHTAQTAPKAFLHNEAREIATRITLFTIENLHEMGVNEIMVADSHWYMGNIYYEKMPKYVKLIRGSLRPVSMVFGIENNFDFAIFLGYHSSAGTMHSILDHTYSGFAFSEIKFNGRKASEFYLNALLAGENRVPVILVAGDNKLKEEINSISPMTEYVVTKESVSRLSAIMDSLINVENNLKIGLINAMQKFRKKEINYLETPEKKVFEFKMRETEFADACELIPGIQRIDSYTLKFEAKNISEGYKVMQLLAMVSSYVDYSVQSLR